MSDRPAVELLPPTPGGRIFAASRPVRLADVDAAGTVRLDAVARFLQDVANDDAADGGWSNGLGWVVRRTMITVRRPLVLGETIRSTTFCTGAGRSWAERRTTIECAATDPAGGEPAVDAVSLWVQIDPRTGRPARLDDHFDAVWGAATGGRVVSSKLSLPAAPDPAATPQPWRFRRTDLDPYGHVNNAAHWSVVEEVLHELALPRLGTAELEYLSPAPAGEPLDLFVRAASGGVVIWVGSAGRPLTSARWSPASG